MIETALGREPRGQPAASSRENDVARELRAARRRIAEPVELVGEPAEVVDRLGPRRRRNLGRRSIVVSRNHDDGRRRRQARTKLPGGIAAPRYR